MNDVFAALADELERRGVTTLYTVETPDLFGPQINAPMVGRSVTTHNIILLRHVELNSHLYRLISLLKVRDRGHHSAIREFRITGEGIEVASAFRSVDAVLSGTARSAMVQRQEPHRIQQPAKPKQTNKSAGRAKGRGQR